MKKYLVFVIGLILALSISCFACAEEDYSYLNPNCPFEIRNGIKFGMTLEEVQSRENNELNNEFSALASLSGYDTWSTNVALGGLEGYELNYQFKNNTLVAIEYFFEYPRVFSFALANAGLYSMNDYNEFSPWIENISIIKEAMESKYGPMSEDKSNRYEEHYVWNITYDNCLCGVDISVASEYNPYIDEGGLWCNRITYTSHDYQSDIDALMEHQKNIKDTSNDL